MEKLAQAKFLEAGCGGGVAMLYAWIFGLREIVGYDQHWPGVQAAIKGFSAWFNPEEESVKKWLPTEEQFAAFFKPTHGVDIDPENMSPEALLPEPGFVIAHFIICLEPAHTEFVLRTIVESPRGQTIEFVALSAHKASIKTIHDLIPTSCIIFKGPGPFNKKSGSTTLFVIKMSAECRKSVLAFFDKEPPGDLEDDGTKTLAGEGREAKGVAAGGLPVPTETEGLQQQTNKIAGGANDASSPRQTGGAVAEPAPVPSQEDILAVDLGARPVVVVPYLSSQRQPGCDEQGEAERIQQSG